MLAQNFKTATDLGISEAEVSSLIKVLGMLERGEIGAANFNMGCVWLDAQFNNECGSVGCLCGWAHHIDKRAFPELGDWRPVVERLPKPALALFAMNGTPDSNLQFRIQDKATPAMAAIAHRSYLTTGEANWAEALASA